MGVLLFTLPSGICCFYFITPIPIFCDNVFLVSAKEIHNANDGCTLKKKLLSLDLRVFAFKIYWISFYRILQTLNYKVIFEANHKLTSNYDSCEMVEKACSFQ